MARKKKDIEQVTVVKGSHLTVTTYPDGRTELEWDDEALARDVREAIESYQIEQLKPAVKAKVVTRKKKLANKE
jgi:S-adenosylmethionine/arginine decarboxylase-like enzyme